MLKEICNGCYYNRGWCNRLVVVGGLGMKDRVASDFLNGNTCDYRKSGVSVETNKPNFENS